MPIIIDGVKHYRPREIFNKNLISNSKGKPDYYLILRLIKSGRLEHKIYNKDSKTPYYLVPETSLQEYILTRFD